MTPQARSTLRHVLAWAAALAVLGLVFAAYLSPHFVVDLASRVWACF
ncbi:MAG: hypothetical protein MUF03_05840 [Rubrivivax sp.]|jgi:hypothetical protein|nr:hypothetical protein [Rubrivivax sp.]